MSKFSNMRVKYGTTERGDILSKTFEHINTTKNVLADCSEPIHVKAVAYNLFGNNVNRFMNTANVTDEDIYNAFGSVFVPTPAKHRCIHGLCYNAKSGVRCGEYRYGKWFRTDSNGNTRFNATFKRLFYGIADSANGFHTLWRLHTSIARSAYIGYETVFYLTMSPVKGGTEVK